MHWTAELYSARPRCVNRQSERGEYNSPAQHGRSSETALHLNQDMTARWICIAVIPYSGYRFSMKVEITMTERGVVTLPAKLRKQLGLKGNDRLIAETTPEGLLLRPAVTLPIEIYSEERLREFDEAEAELAVLLDDKS